MKFTRSRNLLIILASLPFIIGSLLGMAILSNPLFSETIGNTRTYTLPELAVQAAISVGIGVLVVLSLYYVMERRGPFARKLVVAMVVSPVLSVVFFVLGQALLLVLFKGATNSVLPSLLSVGSLGVLLFSMVFIMMDAIPQLMRNLFVAFYGSIFGTFIGISFVTSSMLVLIVCLALEDALLIRYSPASKAAKMSERPGSDPFDYTRIQSESVAVGAGDYVAFSLISAHAVLYFPIHIWLLSILLGIVGIIINVMVFLKEQEPLPGIPVPAIMAILPWMAHLILSALIAA
jgi:hypothetical protein